MVSLTGKAQIHTTTIENDFLDLYLAKASGENIKVFLMLLRLLQSGTNPEAALLAEKLDMTEGAVNRALDYWREEGLISEEKDEKAKKAFTAAKEADSKPFKEKTLPAKQSLSSTQLKEMQKDEQFRELIYVSEMYLNHPITNMELNSLVYIYDQLKLPKDLIIYLIEYCISNHKTSFRYMEAVAINWHEKGITTIAQAKNASSSYQKDYYTIMKAMGLNSNPAPSQIEFMEQWIYQEGYSMSLILEACKRTITQTGKASFPYANGILSSWKKSNLHSLTEIEAADRQFEAEKAAKNKQDEKKPKQTDKKQKVLHNFSQRSYDFDALEQRYIEKINQ